MLLGSSCHPCGLPDDLARSPVLAGGSFRRDRHLGRGTCKGHKEPGLSLPPGVTCAGEERRNIHAMQFPPQKVSMCQLRVSIYNI